MGKCSGIKWSVALLAIALVVMALGSMAAFAMTPAGTMIGNQAVAEYTIGDSETRTTASNVVYVRVKQVSGVSVFPDTVRKVEVTPNQTVQFSFRVENTGNGADSFLLTREVLADDGQLQPLQLELHRDVNGNGVIDAGDVQVPADNIIGPVATGDTVHLIARFRVPSDAEGGVDKIQLRLKAASTYQEAVEDQSGVITFDVVTLGVLAATMEATSEVLPGGKINYKITVVNQGMQPVSNGAVEIKVPGKTDFEDDSLKVNDEPTNLPEDNIVNLPNINAGQTAVIEFQVAVDRNHEPGFIRNSATVRWGDDKETETNEVQTRVLQTASIALTPPDQEEDPTEIGKSYWFKYTVTNKGNGIDRIYVSAVDEEGWAIALYSVDQINELPKLSGRYTVGNLNANASTEFYVRVTVPASAAVPADGDNKITVTAQSAHDPAVGATVSAYLRNLWIAGVDLDPVEDSNSGDPGKTVDYAVTVNNLGPAQDLFELTVNGVPSGYAIGFFDTNGNPISNITVPGDDSETIIVRVTIPDVGPDPEGKSFTIKATSQNNSSKFDDATLTIGVNEVLEIDLASNRSGSASRNGFTEYTVTLRNLGNSTVDVDLEFENINRLEYMFVVDNQTTDKLTVKDLVSNATREIRIRVYVPSETAVGTVETARVTATVDKGGETASDFVTLTTTVIGGELTLQKHVEGEAPDAVYEAAPGEQVTYVITAKNISVTPLTNVVIYEKIPAYTTFVSVTTEAEVSVEYSTDSGASDIWTQLDPDNIPADFDYGAVTDVRWVKSGSLAANSEIEVTLTVEINDKKEE